MIAEHTPNDDLCPECKGTGIVHDVYHTDGWPTTIHEVGLCDNCIDGYLPRCGECGELLQHVRPGKWQCVNDHK